jgi:hypothetical protein
MLQFEELKLIMWFAENMKKTTRNGTEADHSGRARSKS